MDELERYLARRIRRQKFVITIRDPAEPARWARLQFEDSPPKLVFEPGRLASRALLPDDPDPRFRPHLRLKVNGGLDDRIAGFTRLEDLVASGQVDFVDRMAGAGWTEPRGYSDRGSQSYSFRRHRPPDDTPATLAAIARGAAAALLGTDQYLLTIEPFQGEEGSIGENAGVGSLITMGGFVVTAPIVAILVALVTRNPLEVALVAGALVAIAALYLEPPFGLDIEVGLTRFERSLGESALVELPIVGPLIALVLAWLVPLVGVWVPIVVAIVITSVL
jgi:hypothetical protein